MIFQNNDEGKLSREISLRINAIRETFEEMGIILCRHSSQSDSNSFHHSKSIDIPLWQEKIHNKKTTFLEFCEKFELVPQIEFIHKWNCWLSPTVFHSRRFATATFFIKLNECPLIYPEAKEVQDFQWVTPTEIFMQYEQKKVWIPPPVFFEIHQLERFRKLGEIMKFLEGRRSENLVMNFAVQYQLSDGVIMVLPGDELYPPNPNFYETNHEIGKFNDATIDEMRRKSCKIRRFEMDGVMDIKFVTLTKTSVKL